MELMNGVECFRNKVALNLLGNAGEDPKFVPVHFDERKMVAFQVEIDKEN